VTQAVRNLAMDLQDASLLTLKEMAATLGVSTGTVKIWRDAKPVSGLRYHDHGQMLYHPPGPQPTHPPPRTPANQTPTSPNTPTHRNEPMRCSMKPTVWRRVPLPGVLLGSMPLS